MHAANLSLRDLEYVVAVAEERHFGRAAERCNVSQPALSAQIRKLEDTLGLVLFERTSRRVLLTEHGDAVVRQARVVLEEAQKLLWIAQRADPPLSGRFALGAIQTLGPYLFPLILRSLREQFPRLSLHLTEGHTVDLVAAVRDGRMDAALLSLPLEAPGVILTPLFDEPLLVACPSDHPLTRMEMIVPTDLAGPDLLLLDEGNCLRDQAIAACGSVSNGRQATTLETLRSMVAAGSGYTLLPLLSVRADADGLVVTRTMQHPNPARTIVLARRERDPRLRSFELLVEFFRTHAPPGTNTTAAEAASL
jgi:LysR family transcriptional regulator, hydrogen peroxide-inducible genes activator